MTAVAPARYPRTVFPARGVKFEDRVRDGVAREILAAPAAELGGILLGRLSGDRILIEDFEPVPCEHRYSSSYVLSDDDLALLSESVEWARTLSQGGLEALGFYRSQIPPGHSWNERDEELMRRFFPSSGSLFLLLQHGAPDSLAAEFFVLDEGTLRPAADPAPFEADRPAEVDFFPVEAASVTDLPISGEANVPAVPAPPPAPEPPQESPVLSHEAPAHEATPPAASGRETRPSERYPVLPPPTRPRRLDAEETPDRSWLWVAALVGLTAIGAVIGYRTVAPPPAVQPVREEPAATRPSTPSAPASKPATLVNEAPTPADHAGPSPLVPPAMEQGIQAAIQRWQRAIRSGDPDLIQACYAPQVERYFDQRNSSSAQVRRAALRSVAHYGRPSILRVTGLTIDPVSDDRAIATFRKHWQTRGPKVFAGEEQERLAFVRLDGAWKIASEEETKVYWTQRPR